MEEINIETMEALEDSMAGKVETFDTVDELFADAGIDLENLDSME